MRVNGYQGFSANETNLEIGNVNFTRVEELVGSPPFLQLGTPSIAKPRWDMLAFKRYNHTKTYRNIRRCILTNVHTSRTIQILES